MSRDSPGDDHDSNSGVKRGKSVFKQAKRRGGDSRFQRLRPANGGQGIAGSWSDQSSIALPSEGRACALAGRVASSEK